MLKGKQIQYHFQYPTDNPVVYFDADKLEKIVTNLLSNAFKVTPEGGKIAASAQLCCSSPKAAAHSGQFGKR